MKSLMAKRARQLLEIIFYLSATALLLLYFFLYVNA